MAHKHKNENPNPIVQISPPEYFSEDRETVPAWIGNHKNNYITSLFIFQP